MVYDKKGLVYIIDSALLSLLQPKLRKRTQSQQIMCGCKICIQDVMYQESINNWCKLGLKLLKNHEYFLMSGSNEN